ncbi:MAG: 50S ribosomal protein L29 [Dysgonamonadaceae bacterium]
MKQLEIREISEKDLKEKIEIQLKELNQLKINHTITPLDNPSSIKLKRTDIARMHTELRERELKK